MEASGGPPPPPPPPPPGGGGGGAHAMQLPPHLQAMMHEVQMTLGGHQHQERNDQQLPMQFGNSHGRGGGGRGYHQQQNYHHSNNGDGGGRGGRGGRGQRGGGRGGRGRGFGGGRGGRGNGYGGRGGGGGRGRGGFHNNQHHGQQQQHYGPMKRKRDFDGNGAARFFLPSCLEDPWLPLLQPRSMAAATVPASTTTYGAQLPKDPGHHNHQHHQPPPPRPGRVLFQPSFLHDPWTAFAR